MKPPGKGNALIIVVGLLTTLLLIGMTLFRLTNLERSAAQNQVDAVRANLVAHATLEYATDRIRDYFSRPRPLTTEQYAAETLAAPYTYLLRTSDPLNEEHNPDEPVQEVDETVSLATATYCSLHLGEYSNGSLTFPFSYFMTLDDPGTMGFGSLKVVDCASKINLNAIGGQLWGVDGDVNADYNLDCILYNLGYAINPVTPPIIDSSEAKLIRQYRDTLPGKRFTSLMQLYQVKNGSTPIFTEAELASLLPYLTLYSWVDEKVIEMKTNWGSSGFDCNYARGHIGTLKLAPRAPININTAPFVVLCAVLHRVQGCYFYSLSDPGGGESFTVKNTPKVTWNQTRHLAHAIMKQRQAKPFTCWKDFRDFLYLNQGAPCNLTELQISALMANCNPNTDFNKFNPDKFFNPKFFFPAAMPPYATQAVDKRDITLGTTEFCFSSMGYFETETIGRVVGSDGTVFAERWLYSKVKVYDVLRHTTQADFSLGEIDIATGQTTYQNKSLQTAPEPDFSSLPAACPWDGQLKLATVVTDDSIGTILGYGGFVDHTFRLSFDAATNPDYTNLPTSGVRNPFTTSQTGPAVTSMESPGSLFATGSSRALQPEGMLFDFFHRPFYETGPAFTGTTRGLLMFWFKLLYYWQDDFGYKPRVFFDAWDYPLQGNFWCHFHSFSSQAGGVGSPNDFLFFEFTPNTGKGIPWSNQWDISRTWDNNATAWGFAYETNGTILPGEWHHLAMSWDVTKVQGAGVGDINSGIRMYLDGVELPNGASTPTLPPSNPMLFLGGTNSMMMGFWRYMNWGNSSGPAAWCTFDEFNIYIYTGDISASEAGLVQSLSSKGRYHKTDPNDVSGDGMYTYPPPASSAALPGAYLNTITWTAWTPANLGNTRITLKLLDGTNATLRDGGGTDYPIFNDTAPYDVCNAIVNGNGFLNNGFKYRFHFKCDGVPITNYGIVESPYVDDITITYWNGPPEIWVSQLETDTSGSLALPTQPPNSEGDPDDPPGDPPPPSTSPNPEFTGYPP